MVTRYPLAWPADKKRTPAKDRVRASFGKRVQNAQHNWTDKAKLSVADSVARIKKELDAYTRLGHDFRVPEESIIISCNLATGKKGMPLSSLPEPEDPGVAVYFTLDGDRYCLPCDKWDKVADNMAAVAAHIAAMRGIERWGVGDSHDAYTGFKALPEGTGIIQGKLKRPWWRMLGFAVETDNVDAIKRAHRVLSKLYHPDNGNEPDAAKFQEVQEAYKEAINNQVN